MQRQSALSQRRGSWLNLLQLIFVSDRDVCALAITLAWSGRPESVEAVNRSHLPIVLITGGGASLAGLMAFGTAHALLTSRSGRGCRPSAIRAGGRRHLRVGGRPRGGQLLPSALGRLRPTESEGPPPPPH